MFTATEAMGFEFLMWKAYEKLGMTWDKKLLIYFDGQILSGNFFKYDGEKNPYTFRMDSESPKVGFEYENRYSQPFSQLSKKLNKKRLEEFLEYDDLDALISMYVIDTLKSNEEFYGSFDVSHLMLFKAKSLTTDQEYPFIRLGNQVNILSVID